jgi:N-methylhydantoinase B
VSVCQGDVRNAPIEAIELKAPVILEERALRPDSGGPGTHRGGLGLQVRVRNLIEGKWNLARSRRRKCPPWGIWGGRPGETAEYLLRLPTEEVFQPVDQVMRKVPAGSEVIVLTGGGGGWGPPEQRDPAAVLEDVRQGIVSIGAAENDYRVVIRGSELDLAATDKLRAAHRHN